MGKDTDYAAEARGDARDMVQNFEEQIREQARGGQVSDDFNNDFSGGDSYHHESHVDKDYSLSEAADLLDQLSEHEETDRGLWEGLEPRRAICAQAAYTYGNAVASEWSDLIGELNTALGNTQPDEGCDHAAWNEAVAACWIYLLDEKEPGYEAGQEEKARWALACAAQSGIGCCQGESDFTAMLVFLDWLDEKQKIRVSASEDLRGLIRAALEKEFDEEEETEEVTHGEG